MGTDLFPPAACVGCGGLTSHRLVEFGERFAMCTPCDSAWAASGEHERFERTSGANAEAMALVAFGDFLRRLERERASRSSP